MVRELRTLLHMRSESASVPERKGSASSAILLFGVAALLFALAKERPHLLRFWKRHGVRAQYVDL